MEKIKTINIKGKEYVQVAERVRLFSKDYKNGRIATEIISQDENTITMKATVVPDVKNMDRYFEGFAHEDRRNTNSMVNKTSHIENCQTSAIGRALALAGIGLLDSIASADEVKKATSATSLPSKDPDMRVCNFCGAEAVLSKGGKPYCPNFLKHKKEGIKYRLITQKEYEEQKQPTESHLVTDDIPFV